MFVETTYETLIADIGSVRTAIAQPSKITEEHCPVVSVHCTKKFIDGLADGFINWFSELESDTEKNIVGHLAGCLLYCDITRDDSYAVIVGSHRRTDAPEWRDPA